MMRRQTNHEKLPMGQIANYQFPILNDDDDDDDNDDYYNTNIIEYLLLLFLRVRSPSSI